MPLNPHDVAQIPVLEQGVQVFTHVIAGDIDLNPARGILQSGKTGFAHDTFEHHAASHFGRGFGHAFAVQVFGCFLAMGLVQVGCMVLGLEIVGKCHTLAIGLRLAHGFELFAALCDQLVFILGRRGLRVSGVGSRVRHGEVRLGSGAAGRPIRGCKGARARKALYFKSLRAVSGLHYRQKWPKVQIPPCRPPIPDASGALAA